LDFASVGRYFFKLPLMKQALPTLASGLWVTVKVSFTIMALGFSVGLILVVGTQTGLAFGFGVLVSYVIHIVWKMARFDPHWMDSAVKETVDRTVEEAVDKTVEETVGKSVDETVGPVASGTGTRYSAFAGVPDLADGFTLSGDLTLEFPASPRYSGEIPGMYLYVGQ